MGLFNNISDKDIIEGIRQQDEKILNWLYDNYLKVVKKHVLNNGGSDADVSDVFQDSIIILYNQITNKSFNLTTDLRGYFFGIARNIWNNQFRKTQKTTSLEIDIADDDGIGDENYQMMERVVNKAFQKLTKEQQMVLKLFAEGKSYEIIAEQLDLKNEVNARRKKYLCKEALLDIMKEDPEYQEYLGLKKK